MDIYNLARQFKEQLAAGDRAAATRMAGAYLDIFDELRPELERALAELTDVGPADVAAQFEVGRLRTVLLQLDRELRRFAENAGESIRARQAEVARLADEHASELAKRQMGPAPEGYDGPTWARLPAETVEQLAGFTATETPLDELLQQLVPHGVDKVKEAMLNGALLGKTPKEIADGVGNELGANMARFLTIQRTAEMEAYREGQRLAFEANAEVMAGWRWLASLSFDTCLACLAQHGTLHPITETMDSHWNCRCVPVPETKTWEELGFPGVAEDVRPAWETGEDWLRRQSEENQIRTLRKSRYEAWKSGEVKLDDFVEHIEDPVWGKQIKEKSLKKIKQAKDGVPADTYRAARHIGTELADLEDSDILEILADLPGGFDERGELDMLVIAEWQGFTALPKVIPDDEWIALMEEEFEAGNPPIFRGLSEDKLAGIKAQVVGKADPAKAAKDFLSGQYYASTYRTPGQPAGIYFAEHPNAAEKFAGGRNGQLIKAVLDRRAKIIDLQEVRVLALKTAEAFKDHPDPRLRSLASIFRRDPGYAAAIMGYDAVAFTDATYGKIMTVYNRSALIVSNNTRPFNV